MLALNIDTGNIEKQLEQLAFASGKTVEDVARDQMRLWLNDLIKRTPPFPKGNTGKGNSIDARRTGEGAVESGFSEIFWPVFPRRKGNNLTALVLSGILNVHKKSRDIRGRTRRNTAKKIAAHRSDLKKAIRQVKKHVGRLKAGWLGAADQLKTKTPGRVIAPVWVKRHNERGSYRESGRGFLDFDAVAQNKVDYASLRGGMRSIIAFTQKIRQRDLDRKIQIALRKDVNNFNSKR